MAIDKSNNIANDPNINSRLKGSVQVSEILERFNVTKVNNILPGDEAFGYLSEKVDQCIDSINNNDKKTTFPGIGTTSTKCKAGNTTTISTEQAENIANTKKTLDNLKIVNATKGDITFGPPDESNGNMVIQVVIGKNKFNYTLSPSD